MVRPEPPRYRRPLVLELRDRLRQSMGLIEVVRGPRQVGKTIPARMLLTGSSSVLVAWGGRESPAGRVFTTEPPAFSFREVLECWKPELAISLPPAIRFGASFEGALVD